MAGNGSHGRRSLDGGLAEKVQAQLGILDLPAEQRAVDRLGSPRRRVCPHLPPGLPRLYEHPRRAQERVTTAKRIARLTVLGQDYAYQI